MKKFTLLLSLLFAMVSVQAQDYLISFAGTGVSATVGTVTVENLTQGKNISLLGSEVLHLVATGTGIKPVLDNENALRIYPNPTTGNSTVEFVANASGTTNIELFDITGRRIGASQNSLTIGTHSYLVSGLRSGIYTVRITSPTYFYTGKLVSNGAPGSDVKISYMGNGVIPVTAKMLKSASTEKTMQYTTGDILKFTGVSGNYSTLMTDIPIQSKTITFPFVACTDGDGNNYTVVQIGSQLWMGENLKTTKYNDGSSIPNVTDNSAWLNLTTPGYCWYNNDITNKNTYGALYNWYTINTAKLCPVGWHVPTAAEWTILFNYFGGDYESRGKLKEKGITHWQSPNSGATNESGFSALPGGYKNYDGEFNQLGYNGAWWISAKEAEPFIVLYYDDNDKLWNYGTITGLSVRCVNDNLTSNVVIPAVHTTSTRSITYFSAICGGDITSDGGAKITEHGVCWSTSQNPTIANSKTTDGTAIGYFESKLTGLITNTTYYVRAYATNSKGTAYGNQISFTTEGSVTDIDGNVYHTITIGTQVWMVENLKTTKYRNGDIIGTTTPATLDITGQSMPKYQWAYAGNESRVATYGRLYTWYALTDSRGICPLGWHVPSDAEWTTLTSYLGGESEAGNKLKETGTSHWPYPGTAATNETGFTALPGGDRYFEGNFYEINKVGYWWSSTEIVDNTANAWVRGIYNNEISRLDDSYKAWGMSVRCLSDVSTAAVIPDIYTTYVYDITATTATCGGGIITNNGGATVTTKGVCWSTDQTPTIADSKTIDDTGFERFTSKITNLSPNTKYYIRAYVTNSIGTGYGSTSSFTTQDGLIVLTTSDLSKISRISASCGGDITNNGGATVTTRGVCWSTGQTPTIADSKTTDGSGDGSYTSTIIGLEPNTTYYIRAYATNSIGTGYGSVKSFITLPANYTVTDIDGNVYNTITIGTQVWMVENLKTTKYNDGTSIQNITDDAAWANLTTPSYCWYNNDITNKNSYGALYNWYTVKTGKLCPKGWHVPTDAEWTTLTTFLGGEGFVAWNKLVETGTSHWRDTIEETTNESGFTALPGGIRYSDGYSFQGIRSMGNWWSSSESTNSNVWIRQLVSDWKEVTRRGDQSKKNGVSVRCVRDL